VDGPAEFRWQAFFQQAGEPLFLLDRRGRLLFVNAAWEALTGVSAAQAGGLACTRRRPPTGPDRLETLAFLLHAPAEARRGRPGHARRSVVGMAPPGYWDLEFSPLADGQLLAGILGRIRTAAPGPAAIPLPEPLQRLRERAARGFDLDAFPTSPFWRKVADQARLAARTGTPVLLVGEPGTGKQWLARAVHVASRRDGPFVGLDCGRLPANALGPLVTGTAVPVAGTLYLHEPSLLPRELQAELCRRLTGNTPPAVLAGCGDPAAEVAAGRLLDALRHALGVVTIELPPLRDRLDELDHLVGRFLERSACDGELAASSLTPEAWDLVRAYAWPGNLAELYEVLRTARQRTKKAAIDAADLPAPLRLAVRLDRTAKAPAERPLQLDRVLEEAERRLILLALRKARGNKSRAADLLSIWRPRLLRRMEALGIVDPRDQSPQAQGLDVSDEPAAEGP
jgi:hypothetical protein